MRGVRAWCESLHLYILVCAFIYGVYKITNLYNSVYETLRRISRERKNTAILVSTVCVLIEVSQTHDTQGTTRGS